MPKPRNRIRNFFIAATAFAAAACHKSPTSPSTTAAALSGVSISTTNVVGGLATTGTVVLDSNAPTEGAVVALAVDTTVATVPQSVTVQSGTSTAAFDILTTATSASFVVTVTATYQSVAKTATFTIGRLALQSVSVSSPTVVAGGHTGGTVTLAAAAPDSGVQVALASSNPAVIVPPFVTIAAGSTGQDFDIATIDTGALSTATITATLPYSGSSKSTTLTVGRVMLDSVSLGVDSVPGGLTVQGIVSLVVAAPADLVVALKSSSPVAVVPATVTIPAGAMSQTFDAVTLNSPPTSTVTITASYGNTSRATNVTVVALPTVSGVSCAPSPLSGGGTAHCVATLAAPALGSGWQFFVSPSDDSVGIVPAITGVGASGSSFGFDVVAAAVTASDIVTIRIADAQSGLPLFSQALTVNP